MSILDLGNTYHRVIVSDEDVAELSKYKWKESRQGYAVASIRGRWTLMHRFITKPSPTQVVDHVDGNRLNNQRENLRCCTISENNRNRIKKLSPSTSKYKGVYWSRWHSMWVCRVSDKYIGSYKTEKEAALAYDKAALEAFGEFAQINNIDPATVVDNRRKKTSKYYGVHWFERDKGWKAQLVIDHKNTLLGVYSTEEDAAAAYNIAAKVHRKDLPLNDVPDTRVPVKRTKVKNIYAGVAPNGEKWTAYASITGKRVYIGTYDTPEEARDAREEYKKGCV